MEVECQLAEGSLRDRRPAGTLFESLAAFFLYATYDHCFVVRQVRPRWTSASARHLRRRGCRA